MSTITVTRTTVPARTVVALRGTVPAYDQEGRLWERLMPELGRQGLTPMGPCGVFEHDSEYREADPTLSIWLPVPPGTTAQAPLEVHELPEQEVVLARVEGPYTQISEAHARIDELVRSEGLTLAPRSGIDDDIAVLGFNRYLVDPSQAAPEDLVTEVCVPLA